MAEHVIATGDDLAVRQEQGVQHFGRRKAHLVFGNLVVEDFVGSVVRVDTANLRFTLSAEFLILRLSKFFHNDSFYFEVVLMFSRQVQRFGEEQ